MEHPQKPPARRCIKAATRTGAVKRTRNAQTHAANILQEGKCGGLPCFAVPPRCPIGGGGASPPGLRRGYAHA